MNRARGVAVGVALLVLVLVAVLAGLLPWGGWGAVPAGTSTATSTATATASTATPRAGDRDAATGLRVVALADLPRQA